MSKARPGGKQKGKEAALELIDVTQVEIDDENWECLICFLMEVDMDSVPYGRSILNVVQNGLRWVVKCISYTGVLKTVEQSAFKQGNYTGYTSIYHATYDKLCEEALEFLNSEGDKQIPINLIARLIKCDILKMKEEDLRRREMKQTIAEEKAEEVKRRFDPEYSQSSVKKDVKSPAKPDKSPKGDKTAGRPALTVKRDTKLRRRGEEWMDIVYIEDAPDDGPDAYIMLMEFLDTELLLELLQIGINLRYVVRINVNPPLIDTSILKHRRSGNERKEIIKRNIAELKLTEAINIATKTEDPDLYEVKKKLINRTKKVLKFWECLNDELSDLPTMLYYKDIAFVDFVVSEKPLSLNAAGDNLSADVVLYDEISYFLYDLYKTFDNYIKYLKGMEVCDLKYKPDESLQEMLVYERLTQSIPLECTDAATVLHCMIEQIEYSEEADYVTVHDYVTLVGANLTSKYEGVPDPVKDFLEDVLQSLEDSSSCDTVSLAEFPEPLVVIYGDEILRKNYHYKFEYVDCEDVHLDFMKLLPPIALWDRYIPNTKEDILSLRCHSKVLLSCMQDMSSYTLMFDNLYVYLFHMLCCHRRRDNMTSPSKLIRDRRRCMCWEYPFAHQDILDLLDYDDGFDEDAENHKDISFFDKYRFVEQMGTSIFLQALQTAFYQFGKPAHFYCALSDAIVLAFSCLRDEKGIKETSFVRPLTAPIGFRDFCSFVINEEWEPQLSGGHPSYSSSCWIQKSKISSLTVAPLPYPDTDFLLRGSIKWQQWQEELAAAAAAEAEALQHAKNLAVSRTDSERLRASLKQHEMEPGAHEEIPEAMTASQLDVEGSGVRFPGYPLGPHRVQFSSVAKECRLSDCCEVEVQLVERLYSRQWVSVRLQKAGHELYVHAPTWPPVAGEQAEKDCPLNFFLRLRCGIIFSFSKTVSPAPFACRCAELPFTMEVSWPCGLHLQLVPASDKAPFYVRQTYLAHHAGVRPAIDEEKKRCCLADGHVLRFTEDDRVHVLCPNSSVFECQVELDVIPSPTPQSSESKASGPKASARKPRNTSKVKKRASSKASQVAKSEAELPVPPPPEVTGRISFYTLVSPDGSKWRMEDGEKTEVLPRHLLRTYTDWEIHETFQRRGDGTNILTKADGTRIVSFPGDTRISSYAWENETEVFCEWSTEELDQYYEWYALRNDSRFLRRGLLPTGALALLDEGYVYVRIKFRMEHPNYATVVATGRDLPLELIMPEHTRVLVYPEGRFVVEAPDGVTLDVRRSSALFSHSGGCESELDFDGFNFTDDTRDWSKPLCRTVDCTGKRFDVNYMGDTVCEVDAEVAVPRPYTDYRCMVVSRDLSGRELIHEEAAGDWLSAALARPDEAVVQHQLAFAPHLSYHLTMGPLGEDESQRWLVAPLEKGLTQAERKGVNRIPSTYGCPPSWFHPFPMRKGKTEEEEEREEMESNPDVLQVRLLSELAPKGARAVAAVQDALQRYLQRGGDLLEDVSAMSDIFLSYCSSDQLVRQLQKSATRQNVLSRAHMRPRWQDKTSPAALELYRVVMARRGRLTAEEMFDASRRWVDQAACLAIALSRIRRRLRTAELNRQALRERIIPPYFRSHWGQAFTFTDDLTTRAVEEALGVQPDGPGGSSSSSSGSDVSREAALAVSQLIQ